MLTMVVGESAWQDLVENVVVTLGRLLERNSRFLEKIRLDISTGDFASRAEVNTDKLTLNEEKKFKNKIQAIFRLFFTHSDQSAPHIKLNQNLFIFYLKRLERNCLKF